MLFNAVAIGVAPAFREAEALSSGPVLPPSVPPPPLSSLSSLLSPSPLPDASTFLESLVGKKKPG